MNRLVSTKPSTLTRIDARVKLLCLAVAVVTCVTTPPERFGAFAGYFGVALVLFLLERPSPRVVLAPLAVTLPFILICAVFIPFLHSAVPARGLLILWNAAAKALFGVLCIVLLIHSTPFPEVLRALDGLRFPRLGVLLTGFVYRYVFVLADEALRMKRARDSRVFSGRWLWQAGVVGRMLGSLFLRSYERGERVYFAMSARGFDGRMPVAAHEPLCAADYALLAGVAASFLALRTLMP